MPPHTMRFVRRLPVWALGVVLPGLLNAAQVKIENSRLTAGPDGDARLTFTVTAAPGVKPERVRFFARRIKDGKTLYLGSPELTRLGERIVQNPHGAFAAQIPGSKLPEGDYRVVLENTERAEPDNPMLVSGTGRSVILLKDFSGGDFELRCRISPNLVFGVRTQPGLRQDAATWKSYESTIRSDGSSGTSAVRDQKWRPLGNPHPADASAPKTLHDLTVRVVGNKLDFIIDGRSRQRIDRDNVFPAGSISFRSIDSGTPGYVDNIRVVDRKTGKTVFQDDFGSGKIGPAWQIGGGSWRVVHGVPETSETVLGILRVPRPVRRELAKTEVVRHGEGFQLRVDGKTVVPLFFSSVIGQFPYSPDIYDPIRRAYDAGVRLFAPIVSGQYFPLMDDIVSQLRIACPEAKFLLRTSIPVPPALPDSEKIRFRDGSGDIAAQAGLDHSKVNNSLSLASDLYRREYVPVLVPRLIEHFRTAGFADSVMGFLINGGGYEGGWGTGGMWPKYLVDVSDASLKKYGAYLRKKYRTVEALRTAWADPRASFEQPRVPSFAERTVSDAAGYRDPGKPERAAINDFLDFYEGTTDLGMAVYAEARKHAPHSFITRWAGGGALNTSFGNIQAKSICDMRGTGPISCAVSIETYGDRNAGGVSLNANYADESVRLHGKMHLQELDLHPPHEQAAGSGSYRAVASVFRREFAVNVLMGRNALWYFDMGFTGPWYDHPAAHAEMAENQRVGEIFKDLPRRSRSEAALIQDLRQQRYYAMSPAPFTGTRIPWNVPIHYNENYATHAPEGAVRLGAPVAGLNLVDLAARPRDYRLYIFPHAGLLTNSEVAAIRALAENGAVCVFMGAAGLLRPDSASTANMEKLLGMRIRIDTVGPQTIFGEAGSHPLQSGMSPSVRLGAGRWYDNAMAADWHRFIIDDPTAVVLGRYANGKVGMAAKPLGKGWIVYAGVALTHPAMYRNLARLAGVHLYTETNDYTNADENFVVLHTRKAGKKRIRLPRRVAAVCDVFSGRTIARNCTEFEVELPAGHTAVYYIGDDPRYLQRL